MNEELQKAIKTHICPKCGSGLCNLDYTPSLGHKGSGMHPNDPKYSRKRNDRPLLIYCSCCGWEADGVLGDPP